MADAQDTSRRSLRDRAFAWYWERKAKRAKDLSAFRQLTLRRRAELDRITNKVEARLTRADEAETPQPGAEWTVRPEIFSLPQDQTIWTDPASGLRPGHGLSIYHDSDGGAFAVAQRPARQKDAGRRFELFFESYEFRGSYLSLALGVPDHVRRPKTAEALVADLDIQASRQVKTFLRLNMKGAGSSDTLHADGVLGDGPKRFQFDMSFAAFEPGERDQIWLDVIFDRPRMVEIAIRDFTLSLAPRGRM
ncbi:MAG: DUF6478 family protein [Pseudomonadota bacterium]